MAAVDILEAVGGGEWGGAVKVTVGKGVVGGSGRAREEAVEGGKEEGGVRLERGWKAMSEGVRRATM